MSHLQIPLQLHTDDLRTRMLLAEIGRSALMLREFATLARARCSTEDNGPAVALKTIVAAQLDLDTMRMVAERIGALADLATGGATLGTPGAWCSGVEFDAIVSAPFQKSSLATV